MSGIQRPAPEALAHDIQRDGTRLIDSPADPQARQAFLHDSGFLAGTSAADYQYREQVGQELQQMGVPTVEQRGSGLGISIYAGGGAGQIEVVKTLPGEHEIMTTSSAYNKHPLMQPNFREALAWGQPIGRGDQLTIWKTVPMLQMPAGNKAAGVAIGS